MMKRERMIEAGAAVLTVAMLAGIPIAVRGYEHRRVAKEAAGAQVVELYASSKAGVWTEEPLVAWNSFFRHPRKRPIRVRAGKPMLLRLTSVDVHHSFSIPQLQLPPQDVTPGRWTEVRLDAQEAGSYSIVCYTVCGGQHSAMTAELEVR
jgi:heme/copper-type cytochrome/quinol oxidase subunit 2